MKIKALKDFKYSFSPSMPHVCGKKDEIIELPEKKAETLINVKYATSIIQETIKSEQKMQPQAENKAIDLTNVENKDFAPTPKKRGRPKKGE
jgi:hypothetical protein